MKALMNDGIWVDIDTSCIFNNQYNTTKSESNKNWSNKRIFDNIIIRIVDDVRIKNPEMCECTYCGKKFSSFKEFDEHIKKEASLENICKGCEYAEKVVNSDSTETVNSVVVNPDGSKTTYKTVVVTEKKSEEKCKYVRDFNGICLHTCHTQCKRRDYVNDYFVRHPYGKLFDNFEFGKDQSDDNKSITISKYIGSYKVKISLDTFDWEVFNSRSSYKGRTSPVSSIYRPTISEINYGDNKSLKAAYNQLPELISRVAGKLIEYNAFVSNDLFYSNPDGSKITEITENGQILKRPKVIETFWKR